MSTRRVRESPRVVAATVLVAGLLVLIGILVASTTAGGSTRSPATPPPAAVVPAKPDPALAAALHSARATVARLRASLKTQAGELTGASTKLRAARANARCWHAKAVHPLKNRARHCAAPLT